MRLTNSPKALVGLDNTFNRFSEATIYLIICLTESIMSPISESPTCTNKFVIWAQHLTWKKSPPTGKIIPFNRKSSIKILMAAPLAVALSTVIEKTFLIMPQSLKVYLKAPAITTPKCGGGILQKFKIIF